MRHCASRGQVVTVSGTEENSENQSVRGGARRLNVTCDDEGLKGAGLDGVRRSRRWREKGGREGLEACIKGS